MDGATFRKHLYDHKITTRELAEKTGYNRAYVLQILGGHVPFTDSAKFKIAQAFPMLADALLTPKCPTCGPAR